MRQVTHVLLTRPPLIHFPKETSSLDLHVLGTPPAFVLSQDQTLNKKFNLLTHKTYFNKRIAGLNVFYIFCSIFKDQIFLVALKRLLNLITVSTSCQQLFKNFFSSLFRCFHVVISDEIYIIIYLIMYNPYYLYFYNLYLNFSIFLLNTYYF